MDTDKDEKKIPDYLVQLMEGCSSYTKVANQFWIALAFFSLVAIFPSMKENKIEMPFSLGHYTLPVFYELAFFVNAILVICFGSAFSQAMRARKLVQRAADNLKEEYTFPGPVYLQDIIDTMLYPALNRVSPLAQSLQGKHQFFPEVNLVPYSKRKKAFWIYFSMKVMAIIVMYAFPGFAVGLAFYRSLRYSTSLMFCAILFMSLLAFFAGFSLVYLAKEDIVYAWNVRKRVLLEKIEKTNS